jgi:methylmalonyl-CoA/ethylmalonyl-CoA epimerase
MRVAQVAQHADDLGRAVAFYEKLLGQAVTASFDPPGLAFFMLDGCRLLIERDAPRALFYLEVDDVRQKTDELRADGIVIQGEPHVILRHKDGSIGPAATDEWMSFILDSEGNTVGLVSHHPSA